MSRRFRFRRERFLLEQVPDYPLELLPVYLWRVAHSAMITQDAAIARVELSRKFPIRDGLGYPSFPVNIAGERVA